MTAFKLSDAVETLGAHTLRVVRGGQGPLVLFLHGFGITADMWRLTLPALAEAGYSVLALDLPGHGASFRPRRPMRVQDLARVVGEVLDALGAADVRLVGNSLGGAVSSEVALALPGRVRQLVLVNALGLDAHIPLFQRRNYWTDLLLPSAAQIVGGPRPWIWRRLQRMIYYAPERVPADVLVLRSPGGWRHNHVGRGLVGWGVLGQLATRRQRLAFAQGRAGLTTPTLIVWGEDDQLLPVAHAYAGQALIPGAQLRVFARCGHAPNIEYAAEFNQALLEFFRSA